MLQRLLHSPRPAPIATGRGHLAASRCPGSRAPRSGAVGRPGGNGGGSFCAHEVPPWGGCPGCNGGGHFRALPPPAPGNCTATKRRAQHKSCASAAPTQINQFCFWPCFLVCGGERSRCTTPSPSNPPGPLAQMHADATEGPVFWPFGACMCYFLKKTPMGLMWPQWGWGHWALALLVFQHNFTVGTL